MHILAIADRGLISHTEAFQSRQEADAALIRYLKKNEAFNSRDDIAAAWRWLEEHDERLSVEIVEQPDISPEANALVPLRRIYDVLYLDMNERGDFYNENKDWSPDTLDAIADVVRSFFPQPPDPPAEDDDKELTPKDRAEFVSRIEQVSPYDEGLDAHGNMVSPAEFMTDLLTDIRHYCDARGVDFAACDRAAYSHYVNERPDGRQLLGEVRDMAKGGDGPCSC